MEQPAAYPELDRLLRHTDWLRALARRLVKDAATAEDLVQETWMAAMKSPPDPNRPVRPWLAGVVRRLARMRARSEGRRVRRQTVAARVDALPSTAALVEGVDTERRLAEVVVELSEPYRTTVLLRYYHDLSAAEIARRQDIPAGTVRWRLKRGLDELRERLDAGYGDRAAWCVAFAGMQRTGELVAGTGGALLTAQSVGLAALAKLGAAAVALLMALWIPVALKGGADTPAPAARPGGVMASLDSEMPRAPATGENRVRAALAGGGAPATDAAFRVLRVVEADGRPAAEVPALFLRPDGGAALGRTDADGRLALAAVEGAGELWLAREGAFFHRTPLVLDADGRELVVPAGHELRGRLVADGEPVVGAQLELDYDQHLFRGAPLPAPVEEAFGNGRRARATTDADGCFRFHGLAANWSGELWLPPGVVVAGERRDQQRGKALHVEQPRTDLVVQLERLPRARGRVVSEGRPVAGALVVCRADDVDSGGVFETSDGTFDIQLAERGALLVVEVSAPDGGGWRRHRFGPEAAAAGFELGDLELEPVTRVAYVARDAGGAPVAGALARQAGGGRAAAPANERGEGTAFLAAELPQEICVTAAGYREARVAVRGPASPLEVVLEPAAGLELVVVDGERRPLPRILVRLHVQEPPFEGASDFKPGPPTSAALVGVYRGTSSKPEGSVAVFETDDDGRLAIPGLRAGVALRVEVRDALRRKVLEQELGVLAVGEWRALELRVDEVLGVFEGRVLDDVGEVLVGATVTIGAGRGVSRRSGLTGQFRFEQVSAAPFRLEVAKRGYVTRVHEDYVASDGPTDLRLTRGRELVVLVRDPLGEPVEGGVLRVVRAAGVRHESGPPGEARQTVSDLPDEDVELVLALAGAEYAQRVEAGAREVCFDVPQHGSAEVRWSLPSGPDGPGRFTLVAEARGRELAPVTLSLGGAARSGGTSVFPALLPGEYELRLERIAETDADGQQRPARPVGDALPFSVVAASRSRVELTP
jgi:RNA polymerase sigma-70 factor (ECF subfamily)